jgi:hypothetical protein
MRTRRSFLVQGSSAFAAAALAPASSLARQIGSGRRAVSLGEIACTDFEQCVGTSFLVRHGPDTVAVLHLVRVEMAPATAAQSRTPDAANEKFTLVLRAAADERLPQDTYQFVHDVLGRFDMFIAPLFTKAPAAPTYEAIFNRARPRR